MLLCFVKIIKVWNLFKDYKIFKTIPKNLKNILAKFNEWILSKIVKVLNSLSILYFK